MHRLFSWTADAVGCWARLVMGVCSLFQKIDHDKSMVDYSAKCAPAFAPTHNRGTWGKPGFGGDPAFRDLPGCRHEPGFLGFG